MAKEMMIDDIEYRIGDLSVFDQFDVARKLIPIISAFPREKMKLEGQDLVDMLLPILMELSVMKKEDSDMILRSCLSVVYRKDTSADNTWVKILPGGAAAFQYQDIKLPMMVRLVIEVIRHNLWSFFTEAPSLAGSMMGATRE